MRSLIEYLQILEIDNLPSVSEEDINNNFRRLSKIYHPDTTTLSNAKDGKMFIFLKEAKDYALNNLAYVNEYLLSLDSKKDKRSDKEYLYDSAIEYFKEEKFELAFDLFNILKDFKESHSYKVKAQAQIIYARYKRAYELYKEEKYEEALHNFNSIKGYEDVDDIIKECEIKAHDSLIYNDAKDYYLSEDYEKAITLFKTINFKDSKVLLDESRKLLKKSEYYSTGEKYFSLEDFGEASKFFKLADNYKDSKELMEKSNRLFICKNKYNEALYQISKEDYFTAIEILKTIQDYKDSIYLLDKYQKNYDNYLENNYNNAKFFLDKEDYVNAYISLSRSKGYKDSDALMNKYKLEHESDLALNKAKDFLKSIKDDNNIFKNNIIIRDLDLNMRQLEKIKGFKDADSVLNKYSVIKKSLVKTNFNKFIIYFIIFAVVIIIIVAIISALSRQ